MYVLKTYAHGGKVEMEYFSLGEEKFAFISAVKRHRAGLRPILMKYDVQQGAIIVWSHKEKVPAGMQQALKESVTFRPKNDRPS